ncbi:MAG: hypothetical protein ACE5HE_01520 [Phycisphaerae bacterium]
MRYCLTALAILASSSVAGQGEHGNPLQRDDKAEHDSAKVLAKIAVVVGTRNEVKALSLQELRRIFLRQKTFWPDKSPLTVYERHTENPIRRQFSKAVLGKTPGELREYWLNLKLTRGIKAPETCRSARLVKAYLARVKGGIGYMYEDEADDTVRIVATIPLGEGSGD